MAINNMKERQILQTLGFQGTSASSVEVFFTGYSRALQGQFNPVALESNSKYMYTVGLFLFTLKLRCISASPPGPCNYS
jgi:hypothetical protein